MVWEITVSLALYTERSLRGLNIGASSIYDGAESAMTKPTKLKTEFSSEEREDLLQILEILEGAKSRLTPPKTFFQNLRRRQNIFGLWSGSAKLNGAILRKKKA